MPPGDQESENDMQAAEARGEKYISPGLWGKHGNSADKQKRQPHPRHRLDGEGPSSHDRRSVKHQPNSRKQADQAIAPERQGQCPSDQNGRREGGDKPAARPGRQRTARGARFEGHGNGSSHRRDGSRGEPDGQPPHRVRLALSRSSGSQRDEAHEHSPAPRNCGERSRALQRLADEAQVFPGLVAQGDGA